MIQKILRARHGEKVVFIPGDHDEALREYHGITFGDIEVVSEHGCLGLVSDTRWPRVRSPLTRRLSVIATRLIPGG